MAAGSALIPIGVRDALAARSAAVVGHSAAVPSAAVTRLTSTG